MEVPLPPDTKASEGKESDPGVSPCYLSQLRKGQRAVVVSLSESSSAVAKRLISLGIISGAILTVCGRAPLGDPIHIEGRGFALLLRSSEAALVQVKVIREDA